MAPNSHDIQQETITMDPDARRVPVAILLACCLNSPIPGADVTYPQTKTVDQHDTYHGVTVADPYRWLENDVRTDADVSRWVAAQNAVTFGYLEKLPQRAPLERRLKELWNFAKYSPPKRVGNRYAYFRNDGLQNQSVLWTQETLHSAPQVLIDPNSWSEDGTIALVGTEFSEDGRLLAYGVQEAGSDWRTWRIMDVATRTAQDDELKWIKFNNPRWLKDGSSLVYARYPEPSQDAAFQSLNLNQKIYLHRIGTPQSQDTLLFEQPDHPEWGFHTHVSDDGRYIVITTWIGTDNRYRIYYLEMNQPAGKAVHLVGDFDAEYSFLGNDGDCFFFLTTNKAERRRVISISLANPQPEHWQELIPEQEEVLEAVELVGDQFIASYLQDAATSVRIFETSGKKRRQVVLSGLGSASGFEGRRQDTETFYSFSSFAVPPSLYRLDLATGASELWKPSEFQLDLSEFETRQVFVTSKDGTKVPMFVTHRKGLTLDGRQPTLLYGYGGFNISLTPSFSVTRALWLELGGVFAMANLRGGGEYGEAWHQAGTKLNKQNVFDDFIACAEHLIAAGYTNAKRLAIQGGSNGGLLVGACMTQRPELFAAALPAVGVMDMLRFHQFTAGRFWVDDYGSADNPDEFTALLAYSPYHRLRPGVEYPATLVTTADTDDRVVPGHSFKYAARLQACQTGTAPVLIRIETRAGHGAGKPTTKIIEEAADQLTFLTEQLGMAVNLKR